MNKSELSAEALFQQGVTEGIVTAADELWTRLLEAGVTPAGDWNGGDVVNVVDQWLQDHGVDTSLPPQSVESLLWSPGML